MDLHDAMFYTIKQLNDNPFAGSLLLGLGFYYIPNQYVRYGIPLWVGGSYAMHYNFETGVISK